MTLQTGTPWQVAALYRFAPIGDCAAVRDRLKALCGSEVRGILLVATEGINGTIAGPDAAVQMVIDGIKAMPGFSELDVKYSTAATPPFLRLKVKIKAEIVTMGQAGLDPVRQAGTYVSPEDWNALIADPDTVVIDTRNDYEGAIGAFAGAVQPNTRSFREFADWFEREGRALLDRPTPPRVAMYCTGGIRCEKSTNYLISQGVDQVYHLQGGILKYLEDVPQKDSTWQGECFVFDQRVSLTHGLAQGRHGLCHACRRPLAPEDRDRPEFEDGVSCHRCADEYSDADRARFRERQRQFDRNA